MKIKTVLALFLCAVMMTALLAGCGSSPASEPAETPAESAEAEPAAEELAPELSQEQASQVSLGSPNSLAGRSDMKYVLIYNPAMWDEHKMSRMGADMNKSLSTGDLSQQIETRSFHRGGLEEEEPEFKLYDQPVFEGFPEEVVPAPESMRSGGLPPIYEVGEKHDFYIGLSFRRLETLECLYVGETCCVWGLNGCISAEQAARYGAEFDQVIYPADVETFGTARFTDGGRKVHILYYPFQPYSSKDEQGVIGFFYQPDLLAYEETNSDPSLRDRTIETYKWNVDHAIINVNAEYCGEPEYEIVVYGVQAHEFQHLICFTDYFETTDNPLRSGFVPDTWLNESMSGLIEEELYPGVKELEGHLESLSYSYLIRTGQSLYNFKTSADEFGSDIGVYGSVYLFSQYLKQEAGPGVFHGIHDYYRYGAHTDLSTAAALYYSVPEEMRRQIDERYAYPAELRFDTPEQEWMSKMTLDFYLSLLHLDDSDPAAFELVQARKLLFSQLDPASIQGGGRVLVATRDGRFEIPEDADYGLIYIGLDADFNPVTGICYK